MHLGAFEEQTAKSLLLALGENTTHPLDLTPDVLDAVCAEVGWLIPYHLQLYFSVLVDLGNRRPTVDDVHAVSDQLLSPSRRIHFDTWDQRLTEELDNPSDDHARVVLTACALDEHGATRDTLSAALETALPEPSARLRELKWLGDVLVSDGYLVHDDGRLRWRSPLLRRCWRESH